MKLYLRCVKIEEMIGNLMGANYVFINLMVKLKIQGKLNWHGIDNN